MGPLLRAACVQAVVVLLVLVPRPASSQVARYLGRVITDIRLEIDGQPATNGDLQDVLETRVDAALTAVDVRDSILRLMALRRFDDVQVNAEMSPRGVSLIYQLRSLRSIRSIRFQGHLGFPEDRLRREVVDRYGTTPPLSRVSDMKDTLLGLYQAHGYANARVEDRPDESRPDQTTLTFEIEAGAQPRIARVNIETDAGINRPDLVRRLQLRQGAPYDPADMAQRLASYIDRLRAKAFYQANVAASPTFSADGAAVTLDVVATRGPRVFVELAGDPVPSAKLDDLVPIKRENSVDQDLIEDWTGNIERQLRVQGYKDAKVENERRETGGDLHIVFTVHRGLIYVIDAITVTGSQALTEAQVLDVLGKEPFRVTKGQPFAERTVEAALRKLEEQYRAKGCTTASAKYASTVHRSDSRVSVNIAVSVAEGQQTLIDSVEFTGNEHVAAADLEAKIRSRRGTPFIISALDEDRGAIIEEYLNRGYQRVAVSFPDPQTMMSRDRTQARVRFLINEGPQILVDQILLVGNTRTKASTIRNALALKPGDPLAYDKLAESQRRLSALGLFRRVQVTPRAQGTETTRDVLVVVQEAPATSMAYGGGLEGAKRQRVDANGNVTEAIELAPRAIFEIGRRNLWGKNRSITFNGSFAVRPQSTGVVGTGLREYRALGTYREPRPLGVFTNLVISGGVEQAVRPAYSFNRRGVRAELSRPLSSSVTLYARYGLDRTRVINEPEVIAALPPQDQIALGRILPGVRLSKVSTSLVRDTRDDSVDPSSGTVISLDGEIAPPLLGSEVGVVKGIAQGFVFKQLPGTRRIVFAGGLRFGATSGYGTTEVTDPLTGKVEVVPVTAAPLSERFFAGGSTTVRGVAEDTLGTPATLVNGLATGGGGLLILNGELRVQLWRSVAAVTFLDAGNVYEKPSKIDPTDLQPAVGVGLRYKSPIGPIRVDVGFNLRRRVLGTEREGLTVVSFGIGQAF